MADQDKVERVARALCKASGSDPNSLYSTRELEIVPHLGGGTVQRQKKAPNWHLHLDEARRFIAASEALAGTITSGG